MPGIFAMQYGGHDKFDEIVEAAIKTYTEGREESEELSLVMAELIGDSMLTYPTFQTAKDIASKFIAKFHYLRIYRY